eukprot:TRINITY_DN75_c0_g1_i1.p1 TRINITY_DN75_c0_g1~~TRINITY_DN75_c0_g1_i1.p1  ORF type:complete len:274 (+),score=55.25 TRINITY_DN75_c0_g1_i1:83-823(+)
MSIPMFDLKVRVLEAHALPSTSDKKSLPDPFVTCKLRGMKNMMHKVQTAPVNNTCTPRWNQELCLNPKNTSDILLVKVYDKDPIKSSLLGMVEIPLDRVFQQGLQDNWFQLMKRKAGWKSMVGGHPTWFSVPGSVHLQLAFGPAGSLNGLAPLQPIVNPVGVGHTGMNTQQPMHTQPPMNTGMSTGGSVTKETITVTDTVTTTPVAPVMTESFVSKDAHSGYMTSPAPQFQWYQSASTTTNSAPLI